MWMFEEAGEPRPNRHLRLYAAGLALMLLGPLLVTAGLMSWPLFESLPDVHWIVWLAIVLAPGFYGINLLPIDPLVQIVLATIYVPLCTFGTVWIGLWASCSFFGDCV